MSSDLFEREIHEQPATLARLLREGRADCEAVARAVRNFRPRFIVIAARGSSDNAARYAQYVFGVHNGLTVALATPALFTAYRAPPSLEGALVIGVSQSGQSPDIIAVVEEGRRQGALTVTITNDPASPLARAASYCVPLRSGEERAVAATKTYSAQLLALAMLSTALEDDAARWAQLDLLPEKTQAALEAGRGLEASAARFRYAERFVVIGRGFNYATAFEIALKLKETSYVIAEPYSSADFRHGPVALIERGFPVVLVAPSDRVSEDLDSMTDLLVEREAEPIVISDRNDLLARARLPLRMPAQVPEWLSPLVAAIPGQLFALALARNRGLDADQPRGLRKVTQTA